jgi:hypothetical protein
MVAYVDTSSTVFVFLYDRNAITEAVGVPAPGKILQDAGFEVKGGGAIPIDLQAVAKGAVSEEPIWLALNGGEAFAECKLVHDLGDTTIELQVGGATYLAGSMFDSPHYNSVIRDRIVSCVEHLCSIDGFHIGFLLFTGDDHTEAHYRMWFQECVVGCELSVARFLDHKWVLLDAIFLGPSYVRRSKRDVLMKCPAWKVTEPRQDILCIFMSNVDPFGVLRGEKADSRVREARAYLSSTLGTE